MYTNARIDSLRYSLQYDVNDACKKITSSLALSSQKDTVTLADLKMKFEYQLPMANEQEFELFDETLKQEETGKTCVSIILLE